MTNDHIMYDIKTMFVLFQCQILTECMPLVQCVCKNNVCVISTMSNI